MSLYAHLDTTHGGGKWGYDQTTPQCWEISNRPRPTSQRSFRLEDSLATAKFIKSKKLLASGGICCSFRELEPFIEKEPIL